ncbi:hypothetical protein K8R30_04055 [archaeon]|nr:hypothetical protein [archaeon]
MIEYFLLILAIPLGIALAKTTSDEKNIYTKPQYFPLFIKILAILIAIFASQNKQITLTLTFLLITTYIWYKI